MLHWRSPRLRWAYLSRTFPFILIFMTAWYFLVSPLPGMQVERSDDRIENNQNPITVVDQIRAGTQQPTPIRQKITLIAIWKHRKKPADYLPHFFASVAANEASIELLFIKFGFDSGCPESLSNGTPNVREVCLTVEEYWDLHATFLCEKWGCSASEREEVVKKLHERKHSDRVNSYFRPFRGAIFQKYMNPQTAIWGWCDMDVIFGNFSRAFPWEIAPSFDVIMAASVDDAVDSVLLYLTGHLAFFRYSPRVVNSFMTIANLQSQHNFMTLPWFSPDPDEGEYSNHLLAHATDLTFLRFPAMVSSRYHLNTTPGKGSFGIWSDEAWKTAVGSLLRPSNHLSRAALANAILSHVQYSPENQGLRLSGQGQQYQVNLREGLYDNHVWFPREIAVDFVVNKTFFRELENSIPPTHPRRLRRYLMRTTPSGPVYDRLEPETLRQQILLPLPKSPSQVRARELLYTHFHTEKYKPWWTIPRKPLTHGDVMYVDVEKGMWVWDINGKIIFSSGSHGLV